MKEINTTELYGNRVWMILHVANKLLRYFELEDNVLSKEIIIIIMLNVYLCCTHNTSEYYLNLIIMFCLQIWHTDYSEWSLNP